MPTATEPARRPVLIRLAQDTRAELAAAARKDNRSVSSFVGKLILDRLAADSTK